MDKIRFFRTISTILLCLILTLCYVHQEIEIVKTGFSINMHKQKVSLLLDQYRSLVYNLSQLESPKRIEDTLSTNEIALCMPKVENIKRFDRIDLAYSRQAKEPEVPRTFLGEIFDRFSLKAEAKVVK